MRLGTLAKRRSSRAPIPRWSASARFNSGPLVVSSTTGPDPQQHGPRYAALIAAPIGVARMIAARRTPDELAAERWRRLNARCGEYHPNKGRASLQVAREKGTRLLAETAMQQLCPHLPARPVNPVFGKWRRGSYSPIR